MNVFMTAIPKDFNEQLCTNQLEIILETPSQQTIQKPLPFFE